MTERTSEPDGSTPGTSETSDIEQERADSGEDDGGRGDDDAPTFEGAPRRSFTASRIAVFTVLPGLLFAMALGAGFLKWMQSVERATDAARVESLQAAKDATVSLLSYQADTAQNQLEAAAAQMTGSFKDEYHDLIRNVVVPGATEKRISASASIASAGSVSATPDSAVVLLLVDQSTTVGNAQPSDMQSSVRVTMNKVGGRWLMSGFDPI